MLLADNDTVNDDEDNDADDDDVLLAGTHSGQRHTVDRGSVA